MQAQRPSGVMLMVGLVGILPALTNVRLGSLQPEDFVLLLLLGFCIARFLCSGFSFRISSGLGGLFRSYGLLVLSLLLMAILAVRLTFYPLEGVSILKQPILFSISKLIQFAATVWGFLWLTNLFLKEKTLLAQAMSIYWRTGILSSLFAILCYMAVITIHFYPSQDSIIGAYYPVDTLRARGFFNEGGPFGLYLVSVLAVGLLRRHMTGKRLGVANLAVLSLAFFLSASGAGFLVAALLTFYAVVSAVSFRKKVAYFVLATAVLGGAGAWLGLQRIVLGYIDSFQNIEEHIASQGLDPSLVMGRVAALYIVPRMISTHPVMGIGIGNYPLMRNDPHYLGSLPAITDVQDLPALGIPGIAAEMGIPATIWLMVLLFAPYWVSRKKAAILGVAALFQPLAHAFGVQLTFFYPWFVSACVLAASSYEPVGVPVKPRRSLLVKMLRPASVCSATP
jgi:hypothetical protein